MFEHARQGGSLRCPTCGNSVLLPSGREPYRYICQGCQGHFALTMMLAPIPPDRLPELPDAEPSAGPTRGSQVPK